jgi:trk system potassium uptake protein TrkA
MKIMIIGGGSVGAIVAEYFSNEGHDVVVVEEKVKNVQYLQDNLDVSVVEGHGTDINALITGGIKETQLFIALTDVDEINIMACSLAKHFGVAKKIARLNQTFSNVDNQLILKELGIDEVLKPEDVLVSDILSLIEHPGMMDLKYFMDNNYTIAGFSFNSTSPYYGKKIGDIQTTIPMNILGYSKSSNFKSYDSEIIINEFLCLYVGCEAKYLSALHKIIMPNSPTVNNVVIYGAGFKSKSTSASIARELCKLGKKTTIIVEKEDDAKIISGLTDAPIILGDPLKFGLNNSFNIKGQDFFVAMTNTFEKNLFASSVAYQEKIPYIVSLVRFPEHVNLISSLPITSFINPATVLANQIMKYHNLDQIISRTILRYKQVECLEILINEKHLLVNKFIEEIDGFGLKQSKIIALWRNNQIVIPDSETKFVANDRILLLLENSERKALKNLI